jgi:pyruvate carboxylase
MLAVKDMAGLLKPAAARVLFKALREATDLPLAFHTHDTSGAAAASVLAAVDAGVDSIDAAMDAMSGTTSQPCLGAIVEALRHGPRDAGIDPAAIRQISFYWEAVRGQYAAFESDLRSGASEVYLHEMPGGQFTNLKEQARSLGLDTRWHEVANAYHEANLLFGDIVKVTPSSKVVGDMALMMVAQDLRREDMLNPSREIAFPASVLEMMRGDLGQPAGGWPTDIQQRVLGGEAANTARPASLLGESDLDADRQQAEALCGRTLSDSEFASYLMYPKVFAAFADALSRFGPVSALSTPVYFYGMQPGTEISVEIERGKSLVISLTAIGDTEDDGSVRVFFELNGQPRIVSVANRKATSTKATRRIAEPGNDSHIAAPMPGLVVGVSVIAGQRVEPGDHLVTLEAMKMETSITAPFAGTVQELAVKVGDVVDAKDLLAVIQNLT